MNETNARQIPNASETDEREAKLPLLNGIHHLTFVTSDMDRLISFYGPSTGASSGRGQRSTWKKRASGTRLSRWARARSCTPSRFPTSNRRVPCRWSREVGWTTSR